MVQRAQKRVSGNGEEANGPVSEKGRAGTATGVPSTTCLRSVRVPDESRTRDSGPAPSATTPAHLSASEALQRLDLLSAVSRALDIASDDYEKVARRVAKVCVPALADLCAVEFMGTDGQLKTAAYNVAKGAGLKSPERWSPVGDFLVRDAKPRLCHPGDSASAALDELRRELRAESALVVPICEGGITVGYFFAATGLKRRGFRPSALGIASEVASRLGAALQRTVLQREMHAASRDQLKAVRRLRHAATAAARLAGAATPGEVLQVACMEARAIQQAGGAMARWWMPDGSVVEARAGHVEEGAAEEAFVATEGRRVARGDNWVAYPLLPNQVLRRAALVVFGGRALSVDEELVFASLASMVPVAFERAVGTAAALAQQARVRAVVSASPVALVGLGSGGQVVLANPAAQRLFGWELADGGVDLPVRLRPVFLDLLVRVRATEDIATTVISSEGFELSLSAAPMPPIATGDDELSVLVAATDLSEVRQAERALVQAQRVEAMGMVASRVAHDFNNLLTVIIGYAELLNRDPKKQAHELAVSNINRAARRAASLNQQLLGLGGNHRSSEQAVDLSAELEDMRPVLERLSEGGAEVVLDHPGRPVVVCMHPSGAEQLVLNLALNACQAMEKTGGRLEIKLTSAPPEARECPPGTPGSGARGRRLYGWAVLTVSDTGPGMSEEVRARCLEPFFTTKERRKGTGLGLPIVHSLVSEAGGDLEVQSAPGEGTTIRAWLPVAADQAVVNLEEGSEIWPAGKVLSGRALLVDSHRDLRDLAQRTLSEAGLELVAVDSPEEAMALARESGPFDVLVTDLALPGISGADLARSIGAGAQDFPILFLTGYAAGDDRAPEQAPYVHVLAKPYRPEELVFAVAALLGARAVPA